MQPRTPPDSNCPSASLLSMYVEGLIMRAQSDEVVAHIDGCAACFEVMTSLGRGAERSGPVAAPAPSTSDAIEPGSTLERYEVLERLGESATGIMYSAFDLTRERRVALKVLKAKATAELAIEVKNIARIVHPNVLPLFDASVHRDQFFVVMEYVEGQSLRRWLSSGARTNDEVIAMLLQASRGLAAAHALGVVHQDLKPDTIRIGVDGRVRVTDFSLASANTVGTRRYMSPEQQRGAPAHHLADQFSFSLTAAECLNEPTAAISRVIERGYRTDPAARFDSMAAWAETLERAAARPRRQRRVLGAVALVSVILAVAALATRAPKPSCDTAAAQLASAWGPQLQEKIHAAIPNEPAWRHVVSMIDSSGAQWVSEQTSNCQATYVRKDQPVEVYTRREHCFENRLRELKSVTSLMASDGQWAPQAAEGALEVSACAQPDEAFEGNPRLVPVQQALADARALLLVRKNTEALALSVTAVELARAEGAQALQVISMTQLGQSANATGDFALAESTLAQAVMQADAMHLDARRATALLHWANALLHLGRAADAHRALNKARAVFERTGVTGWPVASLLMTEGELLMREGQASFAINRFEHAVAIARAAPARPLALAQVLRTTGRALSEQGESMRALTVFREVVTLTRGVLGDAHQSVWQAELSVAKSLGELGHLGEAAQIYQARSQQVGPLDPERFELLTLWGQALHRLGKLDDALLRLQEAQRLEHADQRANAALLDSIGELQADRRAFAAAKVAFTQAQAVRKKLGTENVIDRAASQLQFAELAFDQHHASQALALFQSAVKTLESKPEAGKAILPQALNGLAKVQLAMKQSAAAAATARKNLALPTSTRDPEEHAYALFVVARVDRERTRAVEALVELEPLESVAAKRQVGEIKAWLHLR